MCFWKKKEPKPDWIGHTREEIAEATEIAAGTHHSVLVYYEEHPQERAEMEKQGWGSVEHNEYWDQIHSEAAWYIRNKERA